METLVQFTDVKPGDSGEITFSLHLCDNPGYIWMQAGNVSDEGGAFTEPEDVAAGENAADLADAIDAKLWYDEDCDNVHDDAGPIDIMLTLDFSGSMLYDQYGGVVSTDPIQVDGQSYGETTKIDLVELGTRAVHRLPAGAECRRAGRRRLLRRRGERREHPRTGILEPLTTNLSAVDTALSNLRQKLANVVSDAAPSTPFDNDGNPDPYSNADGIATGTYISEGLDDAQTELASNGRASAEKRNIVLSDGESFNGDGNTNYAPPASAAANARAASPAPATDVYTINVNGSASTLKRWPARPAARAAIPCSSTTSTTRSTSRRCSATSPHRPSRRRSSWRTRSRTSSTRSRTGTASRSTGTVRRCTTNSATTPTTRTARRSAVTA